MSKVKPVILVFVPYYLPGFRSGGPVRTIANFVDHLGEEYDVLIVTSDRDVLDSASYSGIVIDGWNQVGKARVFYASRKTLTLFGIARLLRNLCFDVLYLNSFFSLKFTILPLVAIRMGFVPRVPCVIAPRGEFSVGALNLKSRKKSLYLRMANLFGIYERLNWQASSQFESKDIVRVVGQFLCPRIFVAPDLPPACHPIVDCSFTHDLVSADSVLRLIFLSRVTPMKNLDFLLEVLRSVESNVSLDIFGPLREPDYWHRCKALIGSLPSNISVAYQGEVSPTHVLETFSSFDLFVLPTRGENYGHVVLESLTAGTPVLISDQTPWSASNDGGVQVMPLGEPMQWALAIDRLATMSLDQRRALRAAALSYASDYLKSSNVVQKNRDLFLAVLQCSSF